MPKRKLLNSVIATAIVAMTGCSSVSNSPVAAVSNDLVVFEKGASLQTATNYLAKMYDLETVDWDNKIDRTKLRITKNVTIKSTSNAQDALNSVYTAIPQLAATANTNSIKVTLNNLCDGKAAMSNNYGYETINIDSQPIITTTPLNFSNGFNQQTKTPLKSVATKATLDTKPALDNNRMTGAESLKAVTTVTKIQPLKQSIQVNSGNMLSLAVIKQLDKFGYSPIWMLNDKTAKSLNSKAVSNFELNTASVNDFVYGVATKLTELGGQTVNAKIFPGSKQVVFHLHSADNVALYNMTAGRLSTNIENLAKQFGWKLDQKRGWLAAQDYPISVDYPVVAENNIDAVLTKMLQPYNTKIKHQLVESIKEIFIVDAK